MPSTFGYSTGSTQIRGDASEKDKELIKLVLDLKDRTMHRRWLFEREWYQNILYYIGQQWIVADETYRRWRRRNMPGWVPLPVTNRLASTVNTIRATISQVQPAYDARPMQDNERSVLSAHASEKYLEVLQHESGMRMARRQMASWVTLTGNAFLFTEFDSGADTGTVDIPGERCDDCGFQMQPEAIPENLQCPQCGSQNLTEDPTVGQTIPQGRLRTRCIPPFSVFVDPYIMDIQDQPGIIIQETRAIQAVKQAYPKTAKDISSDTEKDIGRYYLDSLAYMTGSGFGSGSFGRTAESENDDEYGSVTLYKAFITSCKKYPQGVYIVMSGDQHILESSVEDGKKSEFPFKFKSTKRNFYPIVHIRYDDVPGRFWGKTPINDIVPKQKQRNEMESLYQTIIMRCANPVWLLPLGVQTSPITGDPSLMLRYTGTQGQKPERLPGLDAPISVIKFIEQIDQDFEELANTFAVMKGKSPGNVRAASAIQMLIERGFGRYGTVFDNLEEAYENWAIQALEIWRQRAIYPRAQAISKVAGGWQFMEFLGADLSEVDIRVEAGSTRPKSQAGRQMLVQQLLQMGLLNPNDPEQRMKIFEEMGAVSLMPGAEADIKIVAEENAKFMGWATEVGKQLKEVQSTGEQIPPEPLMLLIQSTMPLKPNPIIDHHPTHLVHHRRYALTDEFRALPEMAQALFTQHMIQAHYMPMLQELQTGIGPTGIAAMMMMQAQGPGNKGQSTPSGNGESGGQPKKGKGTGGEDKPTGSGTKVEPTMGSY